MQRPEPPTAGSRAEAQAQIESNRRRIQSLSESIASTEDKLAQIITDYRCAIRLLQKTKQELEDEVSLTLAYISPIRTLPHELLRHIFLLNFEDQPCCAWGIAAVCSLWRRLVLAMPRMWSKVRFQTRFHSVTFRVSYPVFTPTHPSTLRFAWLPPLMRTRTQSACGWNAPALQSPSTSKSSFRCTPRQARPPGGVLSLPSTMRSYHQSAHSMYTFRLPRLYSPLRTPS